MTPEQQRIAIAEWCGWKWYRRPATGPWADKPMRALYHPDLHAEYIVTLKPADMSERACNAVFLWREGMVPDYLNDLNSIVGVLRDKVCGDADLERAFIKHLNAILDRRADDDAGPVVCEYEMAQITTPADELCEALLRTIGKWENSEMKGGQP